MVEVFTQPLLVKSVAGIFAIYSYRRSGLEKFGLGLELGLGLGVWLG